jgi:hypothetical protein
LLELDEEHVVLSGSLLEGFVFSGHVLDVLSQSLDFFLQLRDLSSDDTDLVEFEHQLVERLVLVVVGGLESFEVLGQELDLAF